MAANRRRSKTRLTDDDLQIAFDLEAPWSSEGAGSPTPAETPTESGLPGPPTDNIPQDPDPSAHPPTPQPDMSKTVEASLDMNLVNLPPAASPEADKTCRPHGVLPYDIPDAGHVAGTQFDVPISQLLELYELLRPFVEDPKGPRSTQRGQRSRRTRGAGASN